MKREDIRLIISLLFILFSFLLGYAFAARSYNLEIASKENTAQYIDISTTQKNIRIKNVPEHIYFRVNGELMQDGVIELKP